MRKLKAHLCWCGVTLGLLWGCSTQQPEAPRISGYAAQARARQTNDGQGGYERVFTNAHVVMWMPTRANPIWDGPTSSVKIDEITPPSAFAKDYKIVIYIWIATTEREFQQRKRWASSNWFYQEHPELSFRDGGAGRQMRKDIWDGERKRLLEITALVQYGNTFEEDVETTKKMIESIKLIKVQPADTDWFDRLTVAEMEQVKTEIGHLQPYMTPNDCMVALRLPVGKLDVRDSRQGEIRSVSVQLREGHSLLLVCDRRGYVISAQLDDKKWEWKKDQKKP